ncbi:MAG TPA: hypothetical protein VHZ28_11200 [Terracidiphilus sp.]|jgi:hypothetical protein|nr:hypothetical protein [Terracidiphilus sp.]
MHQFASYAFIGFVVGLIWGVGCALVLLYSIYLAGYRKAVAESVDQPRSERFQRVLDQVRKP